ncbi:MAG: RNA polymerase sigma factor [Youngiibacter sp.]|nr:RNA polymerase sigma factor [Youngiibacter sp.]
MKSRVCASFLIKLYFERSESAISETPRKYGRYCYSISNNILHSAEDAEECVNETYLRAWNAMPPARPNRLSLFLGKITRNLSLNRYKGYNTEKRGFSEMPLVLSELNDCIPSSSDVEQEVDHLLLLEALNNFLGEQPSIKRIIFVQRYWYLIPVKDLAKMHGRSESQTKSMLFRMRNELKAYLEKEGLIYET